MVYRTILETTLIFSLSLMSITCREARSRGMSPASSTMSDSGGVQDQRVKDLITALSSTSGDQAATELLSFANHSNAQRDSMVQALIADVNKHDELNGTHGILFDTLDYWIRVTRIFEQLKATEALDVMIRCIHCGNELTGSQSVRPAFSALTNLGSLAVPKLAAGLRTNPDAYVRSQIALCLGNIGGPEATKALKQALRNERDKEVVHHIKWGLATIAGDPSKYWPVKSR